MDYFLLLFAEPTKVPVILDATQIFSDEDEDSSQEIYFSLKLPDTHGESIIFNPR